MLVFNNCEPVAPPPPDQHIALQMKKAEREDDLREMFARNEQRIAYFVAEAKKRDEEKLVVSLSFYTLSLQYDS